MKFKYYLRGVGIGIVFATLVMILACGIHNFNLSDEKIISEAKKLGMIMPSDESNSSEMLDSQDFELENSENIEHETSEKIETEIETEIETATETENEKSTEGSSEEATVPPAMLVLQIESGWVPRDVANVLYENGYISDAEDFRIYIGKSRISLRVGTYEIPYGSSYDEIIEILKHGRK